MDRLFVCKLLSISVVSVLSMALAGCSGFGNASFPDAAVNPSQASIGAIQGNVFGGHAPLVGAHVYVLSPGTSGYGSQASSLLGASYQTNGGSPSNQYATQLNTSDPNLPTSWYYETTDATGGFNISGDYSCTAGNPVYLYAYGGSPTYPSASNVFSVNQVVISNVSGLLGAFGSATYTMTTTTTQNFYVGEQVVGSGFNSNFAELNTTMTVLSTNLTTTTFAVTESSVLLELVGTYSTTGTITAEPNFNPAVVNLAVLGICPSTGTLATGGTLFNGSTSGPINFVYMNEVSTAAAVYALEGFTPPTPTSTTNASYIGSSSTNLIGIQNAALNAAQLYDIGGSQLSTVYAGEGHIANPKTPAGNGSVPQNLLDTMGNILAACVDSNNTSTVDGNANESPQCQTLFETATGNGIPKGNTGSGTIPVDTAQAMINIAHYPAGNPNYTASFMSSLYFLPTGNVPFTPNLASTGAGEPNDFTVAIQYPQTFTANTKITSATSLSANAAANGPESIAIDGYGNVWVNDLSSPYEILEMNPQGVLAYTSAASTYKLGYVTIDPSNNVYSGSNYAQGDEIEILASGTVNTGATRTTYTYTGNYGGTTAPFNTDGFYNGYMSVANGAGNVYIGATSPATNGGNGAAAQAYTLGLTGSLNLATAGTFTPLFTPVSMGTGAGSIGSHGAVENASVNGSGDIWWSNEVYSGSGDTTFAFVRVNTSGVVATGFPISYATNNAINRPEAPAVDQSGNLWAASFNGNSLLEVTPSGTVSTHTGNTLTGPFGVTIDGANNVFIGNRSSATTTNAGLSIAEFSIANNTNISPAANGYRLSGQLKGPLNIVMDQSGNLWVTCNSANTIVEWIGAGLPAANPLSLASKNNQVSSEP